MTDVWTEVAAAAASVSACLAAPALLVVGWQAWEMRKTTRLTRDIALDSLRGRLDDQAPQVEVLVQNVSWPPLMASSDSWPDPWPTTTTWRFPRDEEQQLLLSAQVVVKNHSDRVVRVEYDGDLFGPAGERPRRMTSQAILPHVDLPVVLQGGAALKQWARNHDLEQQGRPHEAVVRGTITMHDDRDQGVTDTWDLELSGSPIVPEPDLDGTWRLTPPHIDGRDGSRCLKYDIQPVRHRVYWLSRTNGAALPEATYSVRAPRATSR